MTTLYYDITACHIEQGFITHDDAEALQFELIGDVARVTPITGTETTADDWAARINAVRLTPEQVDDWLAAQDAALVADKIEALWAAADAYTMGYISGVAIGLLTLGVIQGKPKALAVSAWSSGVWDTYYSRKALVTPESALDLDYSSHGPIPYTVPELREELGL